MDKTNNNARNGGTRAIITIMSSVIVFLIGIGLQQTLSRTRCVENDMAKHEKIAGHPSMVEKAKGLGEKIDRVEMVQHEIRDDVKTLLQRTPQ